MNSLLCVNNICIYCSSKCNSFPFLFYIERVTMYVHKSILNTVGLLCKVFLLFYLALFNFILIIDFCLFYVKYFFFLYRLYLALFL